MRAAIEKFTDELELEHLQFRTKLREEMVRLVTEKMLQEGVKEIESVKQQQLTRVLEKVQTEEANFWSTVLSDVLEKTASKPGSFTDVKPTQARAREQSTEKLLDSKRITRLDGTTPCEQGKEPGETKKVPLVSAHEEVHKVYTGHLERQSHTELPRSVAVSSSADLEPDKPVKRQKQARRRSTKEVKPKRGVSWEDLEKQKDLRFGFFEPSDFTEPKTDELYRNWMRGSSEIGSNTRLVQVWRQNNLMAKDDIIIEGDQLRVPLVKKFRRASQNAGLILRKVSSGLQKRSGIFVICGRREFPRPRGKQPSRRDKRDSKIGEGKASHEPFGRPWGASSQGAECTDNLPNAAGIQPFPKGKLSLFSYWVAHCFPTLGNYATSTHRMLLIRTTNPMMLRVENFKSQYQGGMWMEDRKSSCTM